jgi:hypothetical protein
MEVQIQESIEAITAERDRYRRALECFRTMQGEILPAHNDEYVLVSWILDVVDRALGPKSAQPET